MQMQWIFRSLLVLPILISGCTSAIQAVMKEPKVELSRVDARDANLQGATLVFVLKVENPNGSELKVDGLDYSVNVGGKKISDAKVEKAVSVAAKTTGEVELPLPVLYQDIFSSLTDLLTKGETNYKITGTAKIGLFRVPFDKEGTVKLKQ